MAALASAAVVAAVAAAAAAAVAAVAEIAPHAVVPAAPPVGRGATAAEPELHETEAKRESSEDELGLQGLMAGLTGLRLQAGAGPTALA